jgi:hypothetical protein
MLKVFVLFSCSRFGSLRRMSDMMNACIQRTSRRTGKGAKMFSAITVVPIHFCSTVSSLEYVSVSKG